ncbi:hypothetical protein H311_02118 [Anncaliia algerae PRA109]|nr:hypothetical protein H311_02118 [Anncaliia algerae PRA109]
METARHEFDKVLNMNFKYREYAKKFKMRSRKEYKVGDKVRISQRNNLKDRCKEEVGRFYEKGEVMERFKNDSYLVKKDNGKIVKKRYFNLKGVVV